MHTHQLKLLSSSTLLLLLLFISTHAQESCDFDKQELAFGHWEGSTFKALSDLDAAKCLLRTVNEGGNLGPRLKTLPAPLENLIGKPVATPQKLTQLKTALLAYLNERQITETTIGGPLSEQLSRAGNNTSSKFANYFVIHDTSTPNLCDADEFPADINSRTWVWKGIKWNDPERFKNAKEAHLYITRAGDSAAPQGRTFQTPVKATKLERPREDERARGLFLHIENLQPRRCNTQPRERCYKDFANRICREDTRVGPTPGLSDPQMERLALVYVAASIRGNKWLVPAFHAAVDAGIPDAHDDPQNFDLQKWADNICSLLQKLNQPCP